MGAAAISIDTELASGCHGLTDVPPSPVALARRGGKQLLHRLEEYRAPATGAVVGHILPKPSDGIHADHQAPEGWLVQDLGESARRSPIWFGRSLVGPVRASEVEHEITSHTLSDVELNRPDTIRWLEAVLEYIYRQYNQELLTVETMGEVANHVRTSGRSDARSFNSKSNE